MNDLKARILPHIAAAAPGQVWTPSDAMHDTLTRDYDAMSGMIFEPPPPINNVFQAIADLEQYLNTDTAN